MGFFLWTSSFQRLLSLDYGQEFFFFCRILIMKESLGRMGRVLNMAKAKAIILAVLVIVVASVAGYYAAIHYMQTKAVVQAEKDKQDEANKTKLQEQADKETAQKEKVRQKLSASEAQRIKNMVELCDILNGNTQD